MAASLTATEHEIALLAARGRTNREIGAVLGLSPKTVEWNLTKVYRALQVRSRTELAAAWARSTATTTPNEKRGIEHVQTNE